MGELLSVVALTLFAANALVVSVASPLVPQRLGFLIALAFNLVFSALVVAGQFAIGWGPTSIHWDAVALFAIGGLLTTYIGRRLLFFTVEAIGPSRATALQVTNPVFAGIVSWIFLGQALSSGAMLFIVCVLVGLAMTSRSPRPAGYVDASSVPTTSERVWHPAHIALAAGIVGAASHGIGNVVRGASIHAWNEPVIGGLIGAIVAVIIYLVLHVDIGRLRADLREADPRGRRLWMLSGCLSIAAQTILMAAMRYIDVVVAIVISTALPLIVMPISALLLKNTENIRPLTVGGAFLILIGVTGLVVL